MSFSFSTAAKGLVTGGIAVMIAANSFAATDGTVGATSEGTLEISLNIADEVRISNLVDIDLGQFSGADLTGSSPACVYRSGTGNYEITGSGSGAGGAFTLADGATTVAYSVDYTDDAGAETLTAGFALANQTGGDPAETDCATNGDTGLVEVTVLETDMAGLTAGAYAGTLTLIVAPQ